MFCKLFNTEQTNRQRNVLIVPDEDGDLQSQVGCIPELTKVVEDIAQQVFGFQRQIPYGQTTASLIRQYNETATNDNTTEPTTNNADEPTIQSMPRELIGHCTSFLSSRSEQSSSQSTLSERSKTALAHSIFASHRPEVETLRITPDNIREITLHKKTSESLLKESRTPRLSKIEISGDVEPKYIRQLLNAICKRGSISEISFNDCSNLYTVSDSLPPQLTKLSFNQCTNLRALPQVLPVQLEELNAHQCHNLKLELNKLPASLTKIDLSYCYQLGVVHNAQRQPTSIEPLQWGTLTNLQQLNLTGSPYACILASLPNQLHSLNVSRIKHVWLIGAIPETLQIVALDCERIETSEGGLRQDQITWFLDEPT